MTRIALGLMILIAPAVAVAAAALEPAGSQWHGPPADPAGWPAPTHYIAPDGDDDNDGLSPERPWGTFAHAIARLRAGDTLALLDGDYTLDTTGMLSIESGHGGPAWHGLPDAPITVRALNERRAVLHSDGLTPAIWVGHARYWNVLGLTVLGADTPTDQRNPRHRLPGMEPVYAIVDVYHSRDIALKRILAANSNRLGLNANNHIYLVHDSQHITLEECEAYNHHRHAFISWQTEYVTYRRCYVNTRDHFETHGEDPDLKAAIGHRRFGDEAIAYYRGSRGTVENCIIEGRNVGFHSHGGLTFASNYGGCYNRFLGCIAIDTWHASRIDARLAPYVQVRPAIGNYFKDFLVVGSVAGNGLWYSTVIDQVAENVTIHRGAGNGFVADSRADASCELVRPWGRCSHVLRNALVFGRDGAGITTTPHYDFLVEYSNSWDNHVENWNPLEPLDDDSGNIRRSMSVRPTKMGLGPGEAIVFVPEGSNMKGAGKDGADIGANVIYRYVGGELTGEPLWNPETGEFPHGALVEGINDVPGESLFDVHTRLNIGGEGLPLPYAR